MESSPFHSDSYDTSFTRDTGIIKTVLKSGHSVELTAIGYSMYPTFRPGDRIIVKPISEGELPKPGNVIVSVYNGALIMHRLVEIKDYDSGNPLLITRGDSAIKPDKPWPLQQLIGLAESYKRGKKKYPIKTFIPGILRYLFNHDLVWMFSKIMRLKSGLGKLVSIR